MMFFIEAVLDQGSSEVTVPHQSVFPSNQRYYSHCSFFYLAKNTYVNSYIIVVNGGVHNVAARR
jgi:hypothetical protein